MGLGAGLGLGSAGMGVGPDWGTGNYFGQPEKPLGEKQPELKIPTKGRAVTGQQPLMPGPAEYMDYNAPPTPGGSSVPLNRVLPSYQKSAESALNKQDIPPAERKRVKQYFDSLRKGM